MSTKPVALVLGDIHLDNFIWRKYRQISGDAFASFRSLIDAAITVNVAVVLVGDIFDNVTPDTSVIQFFRRQVQRMVDAGLPVYAIQGNHDKRPQVPWYCAIHEKVIHIGDGTPCDIGPLRVVGYDYSTRDVIEAKMATLDALKSPIDVLFIHQAVRQAIPWEGAWNFDLDWVPARVGLVLMGDIHKSFEHTIRPGQKAYYTGASHMRSLPERGPKSALLLHDDLTVTPVPLVARSLERFIANVPEDLVAVTTWLSAHSGEILPPVAWVDYGDAVAVEITALVLHNGDGLVIAEPAGVAGDAEVPGDLTGGTDECIPFESVLHRLVDPDKDPDVYSFVYDLFKDPRPTAEVISAQREKYLS